MSADEGQIPLFAGEGGGASEAGDEGRASGSADGSPGAAARDSGAADAEAPAAEGAAGDGSSPSESDEEADAAPGETPETAITVARLNAEARRVLEERFPTLWVTGEVANWTRARSGHRYFTLRDEEAQVSCVMWRSDARSLPTDPEDGLEVCARGEVSLYEVRGDFQLVVRRMEARGEGLWRLAFEQLKRKLADEGLLDDARKRPIPRVPGRVGVVTSRSGAAVRDVVSVVRRRAPWTRVLVSHTRVQGEEAAPEIVAALERLVERGGVDVIVVTRGGGSIEDLWAFNEEPVARAVAACPVPVISAVGHEVDVTICDLVADRRAPTPSAAGELAVADGEALRADLRRLGDALVSGLRDRTRRGGDRVARGGERLLSAARRRLERARSRLEGLSGRLDALSPLSTLRRGYAVPTGPEGEVLRRVEAFTAGDRFRLRVIDGRVECEVLEAETLEEEQR